MNEHRTNTIYNAVALIFLLLACCLPLYINLGKAPVYMWDEATYANNALDMYISRDPVVVRMEGLPDLYNTKPPFVLWMQTISLHIFGWNEFAIRLPSALFATFTLMLLLWFGWKVTKSFMTAALSMLVLVCAHGYVSIHVTRSGDLDGILVFWMTFYVLIFLKYLFDQRAPAMHFSLIALGLTAAFLSKGIAGWFFIPFMVVISIVHGTLSHMLRQKELYLAIISVIGISGGYYLLREWLAPGYWEVVYTSELMRFNSVVMSWHSQPFGFYFQNMLQGRFIPFLYLLPLTTLVFVWREEKLIRQCMTYLWILTAGYFLLISYPADKLEWYDAPLYPLFSLMIGLLAGSIIQSVKSLSRTYPSYRRAGMMLPVILVALMALPYYHTLTRLMKPDDITYAWNPEQIDEFRITGAFMKHLKEKYPQLNTYTVLAGQPEHAEHFDQIKFYARSYQQESGYSIKIKSSLQELQPGENVVVCKENLRDSIQNSMDLTIQVNWKDCILCTVQAKNPAAKESYQPTQ